jgi:hypothetical protein
MAAVRAAAVLAAAAALALLLPGWAAAEWKFTKKGSVVTYDERSLLIDGNRDLFFSGAIHYTRSPPEVHAHLAWPTNRTNCRRGLLLLVLVG